MSFLKYGSIQDNAPKATQSRPVSIGVEIGAQLEWNATKIWFARWNFSFCTSENTSWTLKIYLTQCQGIFEGTLLINHRVSTIGSVTTYPARRKCINGSSKQIFFEKFKYIYLRMNTYKNYDTFAHVMELYNELRRSNVFWPALEFLFTFWFFILFWIFLRAFLGWIHISSFLNRAINRWIMFENIFEGTRYGRSIMISGIFVIF